MKFLLDSNAVIALLRGSPALHLRLRQIAPADIGMSSIVAHELYYGAFKSQRRTDNVSRIDALQFEVIAFDKEDARRAGEVRAALAGAGQGIGPYDVLIAGQALARGLTLVTHNTAEFRRVTELAGLATDDWEA